VAVLDGSVIALPGDEHPLWFLSDPDRGHLRTPLPGSRIPGSGASRRCCGSVDFNRTTGMWFRVGERGDRPAEPVADLLQATPVTGPGTRGAAGTARLVPPTCS